MAASDVALETSELDLAGPCNFYNYYHDEARNNGGPNRCTSSCHCDGMRTCSSSGWCQGTARPAVSCISSQFHWNEAWTPMGASRCNSPCQCDGQRTCSQWNWCQGRAR